MIKKLFMPFWSFDVEKTEKRLAQMAQEGHHFTAFNPKTRQFHFEAGVPKAKVYHIGYDKTGLDSIPSPVVNNGWGTVFHYRKWCIYVNEGRSGDIKIFPGRDGIINRNRKMMYGFGIIAAFMLLSMVNFLIVIAFSLLSQAVAEIEASPYWFVTLSIWAIGLVIIYATIMLYRSNQKLEMGESKQGHTPLPSFDSEQPVYPSGKRIVKWKFAWFYAPDMLEKWLEGMEAKGYNLNQINKWGNKYNFTKGIPRKVAYYADYQQQLNQSYYDLHSEAGWKLMYTKNRFLSKWSIWSRIYEEGEKCPQLYTDRTHVVKHARRIAVTYLSMFVPLIIMYLILMIANIDFGLRNGMSSMNWSTVIIMGIVIIEFGAFSLQSWLYFRRMKKQAELIG